MEGGWGRKNEARCWERWRTNNLRFQVLRFPAVHNASGINCVSPPAHLEEERRNAPRIRHRPAHAGNARPQGAVPRAHAWLGHRTAHRSTLERRLPGSAGLTLPCPGPDRKSTRLNLQSQSNLVCRLLLEKKKKKKKIHL